MSAVPLNSTVLQAAAYQNRSCRLELKFRSGAVYHYFDVPEWRYQQLLQAESKGRYLNQHIRNHYAFAKIRIAGPSGSINSVLSLGQ